jgi:hypothetical protein
VDRLSGTGHQHARVEDRIRQAKAAGLTNLPCHDFTANAATGYCTSRPESPAAPAN